MPTPYNNPYVPGDPYSYDLKWLVSRVKELENIYNAIDSKIAEQIYKAFQESNLINFKTTEAMLEATLEDGTVVLTDGYHYPGDGGTMIYLIQGFTPEMCQLDYYLTLPGNKIAIPVILFPYVTPIMFGAYGDGTTDDTEGFKQALKMDRPVNLISKTYVISETLTVDTDWTTINNGTIKMPVEVESGFVFIDNAEHVTIKDIAFIGSGVEMPSGSTGAYVAVRAIHSDYLSVNNCHVSNVSNGGIFVHESSFVNVSNNVLENFANVNAYGAITVGYGINTISMGNQTIQNNTINGGHFGIECQGWQHDINISNNKVKNIYGYGIVLYRYASNSSQIYENVQVIGNLVENVHHNPNVGYMNGMGIYAQTINKLTISNNILNNILMDRPDSGAPDRTLSPGAISISGSEEVTCTGNVVKGSVIDGVDVVDVSSTTIGNIVANNIVNDAAVNGMYIQAAQNVIVSSNVISGTSDYGLMLASHPAKKTKQLTVDGNIIRAICTTSMVITPGTGTESEDITVSNNSFINHTYRGVSFSNVKNLSMIGNKITASENVTNYAASFMSLEKSVITNNIVYGGDATYYGAYFFDGCTQISFSTNSAYGIDAVSRLYTISNSDVIVTNCLDDLHNEPFTTRFAMSNYTVVAAPTFANGAVAPTTGTYARGSIVFNTAPASGQPAFWICTVAGTPGTWVAGPTL